ncbi:alpha/beta fold hydrolase [Fulvivirgaceae bacterium PWU5]|uniref:Alpha/beta fold hydrolase n=1 Tax=Dawidia cretensis TaxID=2782350 RepID=A0AAP2DWT0_9BACT|nr:alpha/beta hydrolase [Dawidia cretensis]MBT1707134.1 alpha/beta fold hydrolase [Dawidia cretensis]
MIHYFIIPGLGNSGPEHWQTHFEKTLPNARRIDQQEWEAPVCADWIATIDTALQGCDLSNVVLIGHSLGCSAIAHWAQQYGKRVRGALLVAPSDMESPLYTFPIKGFNKMPTKHIDFKTIVVTSTNDPWVTLERANLFAKNWGSTLINIGEAGHINVAAGFGPWEEGLALAKML